MGLYPLYPQEGDGFGKGQIQIRGVGSPGWVGTLAKALPPSPWCWCGASREAALGSGGDRHRLQLWQGQGHCRAACVFACVDSSNWQKLGGRGVGVLAGGALCARGEGCVCLPSDVGTLPTTSHSTKPHRSPTKGLLILQGLKRQIPQ